MVVVNLDAFDRELEGAVAISRGVDRLKGRSTLEAIDGKIFVGVQLALGRFVRLRLQSSRRQN